MAEYPITVAELDESLCYPSTAQLLLNSLADYITVNIAYDPLTYVVDSSTPTSDKNSSPFFQTAVADGVGEYGMPKAIRIYADSKWQEFSQFQQGDKILVASNSVIVSPWGESPYTYTFLSGTNLSTYAPPISPEPPTGFKYKTYVGAWTSKA
jgi:hypothetical protein